MILQPLLLAALAGAALTQDTDTRPSAEMRQEIDRAEAANLDVATAGAAAEAAKTFRLIRALLASGQADLENARVEIEALLRDPEELKRQLAGREDPVESVRGRQDELSFAGQLLAAKIQRFLQKASSVPLPVTEEDGSRLIGLRSSYNAANRTSDFKRAQADAQAAAKRLGVLEPWPAAAQALDALTTCEAELRDAARQVRGATASLNGRGRRDTLGPTREALAAREKALESDVNELEREGLILRDDLILEKAGRELSGRSPKEPK